MHCSIAAGLLQGSDDKIALSIASNIAEGAEEIESGLVRFLNIAKDQQQN